MIDVRRGFALIAFGCSPCPRLGDVAVRGADPTRRAEVVDELEQLDRDLALDVCIDHVRTDVALAERDGVRLEGTYDAVSHGVRLAADLETTDLGPVLRHEVCHAVDLQHRIVKDDEQAFVYPDPPPVRDARLPAEAFADTCALGPEALRALGPSDPRLVSCPGDPDLRAANVVSDLVYGPADATAPGAAFERIASFHPGALAGDVSDMLLRQAITPGGVVVTLHHGGWLLRALVDARTGLPIDGVPIASDLDPGPGGARLVASECTAPEGWVPRMCGATADGAEVTVADLELPSGIVRRAHAVAAGSQTVSPVSGVDGNACVAEATSLFSFDGELWMGSWVGDAVVWGRWVSL